MDGIKNALTRQLGPLPVWAWGVMLIAVIALFLVWKRSKATGTQALSGGSGGSSPTDWTTVGADPGLVPTQPASQSSVSPAGTALAVGLPTHLALTGSSGTPFTPVRATTTGLTPVIPASAPVAHPPVFSSSGTGITQMWAAARQLVPKRGAVGDIPVPRASTGQRVAPGRTGQAVA